MASVCAPTLEIVPSLYQESLACISLRSISPVPLMQLINHFLPLKIFLHACCCFSCFFVFIAHLFRGLDEANVNPESMYFSNSHFMHSLCSLIIHSFLNGFQPNLYQSFSHVCSTCHTILSLKQRRLVTRHHLSRDLKEMLN